MSTAMVHVYACLLVGLLAFALGIVVGWAIWGGKRPRRAGVVVDDRGGRERGTVYMSGHAR